ncbi:MAG: HDOD domain-containing protein [Inhella sp.]
MLDRPLHSLSAWVGYFRDREIPVLASSSEALEQLRANEDDVDAHLIGETFANDPLMTLKVLRHAGSLGGERRTTDAETVTAAVVLMGITPFFSAFGPQPVVEELLDAQALEGFEAVLRRSERAARFALGFAAHRLDPDAQIIHSAALLHDFAELLLWCEAPDLAAEIRLRQLLDPQLRSSKAQKEVLGIELMELEIALMRAWRLPQMLARIVDDRQRAPDPQELCVLYATRLARHTMSGGFDNAAIPDDVRDIGQLLNLRSEPTMRLLRDLLGETLPPAPSIY